MAERKRSLSSSSVGHPGVWAALTILAFPVVLLATEVFGFRGLWPIAYGLLASLVVLALEACVRGRLWIFEDRFVERISHPATPGRLLIVCGATLLLLETALLFFIATDHRWDAVLLRLVQRHQCTNDASGGFSGQICRALQEIDRKPEALQTDVIGYAVRREAARRWFSSDALVTCAERRIDGAVNADQQQRYVGIVHCVQWMVERGTGQLEARSSMTKFIAFRGFFNQDGACEPLVWSEEPNAASWTEALGEIAERGRQRVHALAISPDFITLLQAEALGRAQELLKR